MRKLATLSAALAAAVFAAHYLLPGSSYLWLAIGFSLLSICAYFLSGDIRLRFILICLGLAIGFAVSLVSYNAKTLPCMEVSGQTLHLEGVVSEYPTNGNNYSTLTVELKGDAVPHVRGIVGVYGNAAENLKPGDLISFDAHVKYSGIKYDQTFDRKIAENIFLQCSVQGEIRVSGRVWYSFLYFAQDIEKAITGSAEKVFSYSSAGFLTALLTGNTEKLSANTQLYSALVNAGTLHVVAVSGLHVSFIIGFLLMVLRKKKTASLVGIPLVWVFTAVAGFTPSIVRAAFMQSAVLAAPLLKRESDALTSLTSVLAVILLINPEACASAGLQLSFGAILGMLLLTGPMNKALLMKVNKRLKTLKGESKYKRLRKPIYKAIVSVIAAFSASVGALVFSAPIMAAHFGYLNTYSILANILIFWAISLCFVIAYIAVFAGMIWTPLGVGLGVVPDVLAYYIFSVSKLCSDLPFSRIYMGSGYFLFWLIAVYIVFGGWCFWRRKELCKGKGYRPAIPTAVVVSLLCIGVIATQINHRTAKPTFTAVDVGQGQSLVVTSSKGTVVIDCGGGGTFFNAGDTVAGYLLKRGITSVDLLCLTHFDSDHDNGVERLLAQIDVKYLVFTGGDLRDETRRDILRIARDKGTEICYVKETTRFWAGDISLTAYTPVSKIKPELIYLCTLAQCDILVTGDADTVAEKQLILTQALPDIDIFVAGHHGSITSNSAELLEEITAETAVISTGFNSYGHPTQECLDRFAAKGMEILRTDRLGNVIIVLEK